MRVKITLIQTTIDAFRRYKMARPKKQGLDFFFLDVNLFSGKEVRTIQECCGTDGISLYLYLLCKIYKNGYYVQLDIEFFRNTYLDLGMNQEQVMQILEFFLAEALFDIELFQTNNILTSRSIQLQFQKAVKERAKKNTILIECYWLLDEEETESFLKVCFTSPYYSGNKSELFTEKSSIIPGETIEYSGKNLGYSTKKTGYSGKNSNFYRKKPDYSMKKSLKNNTIYNNLSKCAITREEKQELIREFGAEVAEEYIRRTTEYHCCNLKTIRKWIAEDQQKHRKDKNVFNTFPQRNYSEAQMNFMECKLLGNSVNKS